jgi:gluconolactonase
LRENREERVFAEHSPGAAQGGNETGGALIALDVLSGAATPLLDNFQGLKYNSPNDVVVAAGGLVYFTDPSCGAQQHFRDAPQLGEYVWKFDARTGAAAVAADNFLQVGR